MRTLGSLAIAGAGALLLAISSFAATDIRATTSTSVWTATLSAEGTPSAKSSLSGHFHGVLSANKLTWSLTYKSPTAPIYADLQASPKSSSSGLVIPLCGSISAGAMPGAPETALASCSRNGRTGASTITSTMLSMSRTHPFYVVVEVGKGTPAIIGRVTTAA